MKATLVNVVVAAVSVTSFWASRTGAEKKCADSAYRLDEARKTVEAVTAQYAADCNQLQREKMQEIVALREIAERLGKMEPLTINVAPADVQLRVLKEAPSLLPLPGELYDAVEAHK